jgi:sec-independent protein translocase protein TatB
MFDVAPSELLILGTVALLVIPPKDLPKAMRVAGYWVGRARGVARQFRAGFDDMLRDAELKEMEARWQAENERIMREHPSPAMLPLDAPPPVATEDGIPVLVDAPAIHDAPAAPAPQPPAPDGNGNHTP